MAWTALTADDIKTRMNEAELDQLQNSSLADGQADPLPDVLLQVTDEVRGYIAARSPLGPAGTLPPQVRGAAISIVRWRLAGRLSVGGSGNLLQSETRRKEYEDALALLRDIAGGKFAVEVPDITGPETISTLPAKFGSAHQENFLC
jgi:phage gp36-like protein